MATQTKETYQQVLRQMETVPALPKGFHQWVKKSVFNNKRYVFYKKNRKNIVGLCSSCGTMSELSKAKHNEMGKCPSCLKKVMFKSINKARTYKDVEIVSVAQKINDCKIVIRYLKVTRTFKDNDDTSGFPNEILTTLSNPKFTQWEGSREFIGSNVAGETYLDCYEVLHNNLTNQEEWMIERKRHVYFNKELLAASVPKVYKRNLKGVIKQTKWKYCGISHLKKRYFRISEYLLTYDKYPSIEMLSKLNMTALLDDVINSHFYIGPGIGTINLERTRLGLSKDIFNRTRKLNLGIYGIELLQTLEDANRSLVDKQVKWVLKNCHYDVFVTLLKYVSAQTAINFLSKQKMQIGVKPHLGKAHIAMLWSDYLDMVSLLGANMEDSIVLFPKCIKEKHDEVCKLSRVKNKEIIENGIVKQYQKWHEILEYQNEEFSIELASSHQDLVDEGKALSHCVGRSSSYAESMANGNKMILFVRRAGYPYSTMQFNMVTKKVIQNLGYDNEEVSEEGSRFVKSWINHISSAKIAS